VLFSNRRKWSTFTGVDIVVRTLRSNESDRPALARGNPPRPSAAARLVPAVAAACDLRGDRLAASIPRAAGHIP